jgi:prolyl-tRNA editing enzyme YbaK/EbsC (Cys-tRNA(Pro) deacylase)
VRVFADVALQRHTDVWSAGGTPTTVFPIPLAQLVALTDAEWVDVCFS